MSQYKKKRVTKWKKLTHAANKKRTVHVDSADIVMSASNRSSSTAVQKHTGAFRVVKGKKLEQKRRLKTIFTVFIALSLVGLLLHFILPVGIWENIENGWAMIGSGSYPITLDSTDTISAVPSGHVYYVLTNTRVNAFAKSGKKIFSDPHGFENPVLKISKTRALVFSQSGNRALIYNLRRQICSITTEDSIVTAALSDSGIFVLVTRADTYASSVYVYDKNGNRIYEWNSAADTVNQVEISPNGKKIAIAAFNAASGTYSSKISILNFKSATPEWSETTEGELIYELCGGTGGFYAVTQNKVRFIHWSKGKKQEYENNYDMTFFRKSSGGAAAVFSRESDRTDNRIVLFSSKGALKAEWNFKGEISDIQVLSGHIYCMSDINVLLFGNDGEVLRQAECGFGAVKMMPLSTDHAAVISDSKIEQVALEQK